MLQFNVYRADVNSREIKSYNIFSHSDFLSDCKKAYKEMRKRGENVDFEKEKEIFFAKVYSSMSYYMGYKCEFEVVVSGFPIDSIEEKVDSKMQVLTNKDLFEEYLWNHRKELR